MKKFSFLMSKILFVFCLVFIGIFVSCKAKENKPKDDGDQPKIDEWEFTSTDVTEAKDIYEDFMYLTIYDDNLVVTVSNDEGVYLIETIDSDSDYIKYSSGEECFGFKKDDEYYFAVNDGKNKYFFVGEEAYEDNIYEFLDYLNVFDYSEEDKINVSIVSKGTTTPAGYDLLINAKLTLEITCGEIKTLITAEKVDNVVTLFSSTTTFKDESYTITETFEVGKAKVTIPDISDWFDTSAPKTPSEWYVTGTVGGKEYEDIPMYFNYITGCYSTDYFDIVLGDKITIKNKNDETISFVQEIDAEFLTGHEMISFDPEDDSIYFECDAE